MNIRELIQKNRDGEAISLPSFCTSNEYVINAILEYAAKHQLPVLLEATCNQCNQFGGYTGMTPADFAHKITYKAEQKGIALDKLILGGDHLGPNPWRDQPAAEAMAHAKELIKQYAAAGFTKIHIDASMTCADEEFLSFEEIASRAAILCKVAEEHAPDPDRLFYIVGTEVPIPGGETDAMDDLSVTSTKDLDKTIETHYQAFEQLNIQNAWEKVVSIVVQPGVDFSHTDIYPYSPEKAHTLSQHILKHNGLSFEAHSTDYQKTNALADLVKDHFVFLKVGPELTFSFREAVIALSHIYQRLNLHETFDLEAIILKIMNEQPESWQPYYKGSEQTQNYLKIFSYSDRIRYYWDHQKVNDSLEKMLANLSSKPLPNGVIAQYFNLQPHEILTKISPLELINQAVEKTISRYYDACGSTIN